MVFDTQTSTLLKLNGQPFSPDTDENYVYRDQLSQRKGNFLIPIEVTFSVEEDVCKRKRQRLTTISSDVSELSQDSYSSTSTFKEKKKIPDGGYGWVIVFASLMVSLIADGISFSFGLLYSELLDDFKEGTTKTAWIGSLFMSVPLISGPVMSNLVDKYGCQKMTMIGGVFGCAGFVLSAYSNSIEMLCFTFGIISGLGLGVIYVTAVVSIAFYFDAKRTFATGIGASGTGIGTFLYAPLTQWLISHYGWRGATLILAGSLLNFCVFGALMVDPQWLIDENKLEARSQSVQTFSNSSMCLDEIKKLIEIGAPNEDVLETLVTNVNTEANQLIQEPNIAHSKRYQSEVLLPTFISSTDAGKIDRPVSKASFNVSGLMSYPEVMKKHSFNSHRNFNNQFKEKTDDNEHENAINKCDISPRQIHSAQCKKASMESLNTSEKVSSSEYDIDSRSISLALAELGANQSLLDFDEDIYEKKCRSGTHGSRYSLNESVFARTTPFEALLQISLRRSNSLCINHQNFLNNFSGLCNESPKNGQEFMEKLNSNNPKRSHKKQRTNRVKTQYLRRNSALRYSNYLKNMRVHRNSVHYRGAMLTAPRYRLRTSSCPNIYKNSTATIVKQEKEAWYDDFVEMIKSIFDFSLFLKYKFGMMSLSTFFLFVWYIIPYFYINELLLKLDYSEEASAYLISIIGMFNTIGMIGLGWIGDQRWCNVTKTYAFCLCLCGVSIFMIPLVTWRYSFLMFVCAIFGVTFGSSFSFTPLITSRLVEMEDFTLAYGLILLVQGIGSLIGPPLAGWIYDATDRWDDSFYIGGFFVVFSGFLAYIIGSIQLEYDDEESD